LQNHFTIVDRLVFEKI